ncbi:MAG: PEP-CTERM sorting domain-containing protein, partial [Candidatus Competibacteraceae bacterium]
GSIVVERSVAVPEPGTLGLLALGCAGLIGLGRKRRIR